MGIGMAMRAAGLIEQEQSAGELRDYAAEQSGLHERPIFSISF